MATYNSTNVNVKWNAVDMTTYVTKINGFETDVKLENITPFGVSWETFASTALKSAKPVQIGGMYDDTVTTGPDAVWGTGNLGTSQTLLLTYGSTKTSSVTAFITAYKRMPKIGALTEYEVTLQPSGTVTEA